MLKKTQRLLTTQKCEAVNRAISSTVPKNVTFSRNYDARVHAAVHAVNVGISEALVSECHAVGSPITPGTRVSRHLLQIQKNQINQKQIKKSAKTKQKRHMKRKSFFEIHANTKNDPDIYQKNICMPKCDHCFSKPYRKKKYLSDKVCMHLLNNLDPPTYHINLQAGVCVLTTSTKLASNLQFFSI